MVVIMPLLDQTFQGLNFNWPINKCVTIFIAHRTGRCLLTLHWEFPKVTLVTLSQFEHNLH